jgi:anti-sigma regulatory factor (Ser/Thr protein kinase)
MLVDACTSPETIFETRDHDVTAVAVARHALTIWLDDRGTTEDVRDTLVLIASELVTNALRNTTGAVRVTVGEVLGGFKLQVFDESLRMPTPRLAVAGDTRGRGLAMVDALADVWGAHEVVRDDLVGKVVWATCQSR